MKKILKVALAILAVAAFMSVAFAKGQTGGTKGGSSTKSAGSDGKMSTQSAGQGGI